METALAIQKECANLRSGGVILTGFGSSGPPDTHWEFRWPLILMLRMFVRTGDDH